MHIGETGRCPSAGRKRRSRGQSLVEFALIVPILMLLLIITIDFGRLFLSYISLNNAARVAANFGAINPDSFTGTPKVTTYDTTVNADAAALTGICPIRKDAGNYNPPIPTYPNGTGLAAVSQVAFTCDFTFITPLLNGFFGGSLPMSATAKFPVRTGAIANIGGTTALPPPGSPVAAFSFTNVSGGTIDGSGNVTGTSPVTVNFLDSSSNAQTWIWDFGDGSPPYTTDASPPTHQYTVSGATAQTFTVTLTITNTIGTSTASHTVTVNPVVTTPIAGFYGDPVGSPPQVNGGGSSGTQIEATKNTTVNFVNTTTGATAYSWDFGDGSAADTSTNPSHAYPQLGMYTVTLSVTAPTGVSPYSRSNYVEIGCVVPTFANTSTSGAGATYAGAGLTGTLWYQQIGAKNPSKSAPATAVTIDHQTGQPGGNWVSPTQKGNQPWGCDYDVTVWYK